MDKHEAIETIKDIITSLVKQMEIEVRVEVEESEVSGLVFNLHTTDTQSLIGRQGSNLHALQLLVQQMAVKKLSYGNVPHFSIDVDDYRQKRIWFIKEMAKHAAEKVKNTGQAVTLEPMPNYERRLVHAYIQENFPEMISESTGDGSSRRTTIRKL
ncbi:MAG: KH domain-containing protein [Candidatus Doudnabacteria bacterium]|nr:KH domain-containing protein [Candidatus Doudnabacteria bacterium]